MPVAERAFVDSNLWIYAALNQSAEPRCDHARQFLTGPQQWLVSGQVLAEVGNVLLRHGLTTAAIGYHLQQMRQGCQFVAVDFDTSHAALDLKSRYSLSWFDALIAASALQSQCTRLYSEDFQHGLLIDGVLRVINPFLAPIPT